MTGFPGACDLCGGPQLWTLRNDELYVCCERQCQLDLFADRGTTSRDSESGWFDPEVWLMEPLEESGVVPPEGSDANTGEDRQTVSLLVQGLLKL
jgi:hypothetical protein